MKHPAARPRFVGCVAVDAAARGALVQLPVPRAPSRASTWMAIKEKVSNFSL